MYVFISVSFKKFAIYLHNKLDDVTTRCSYIKTKVILKEMQIDKAVSQIDLLSNKIKGVCVRLQRAEEQNNKIFMHHLEIQLVTLENVRCAYYRFIACQKRDLAELLPQMFDLDNEMVMLRERMEKDNSENEEFKCDDSENDDSESDESECDESECDEIMDQSKKVDKHDTKSNLQHLA